MAAIVAASSVSAAPCALVAQDVATAVVPTPPVEASAIAPIPAPALLMRRDTPVVLMAVSEVSTADAKPGARFRLRVNEPIVIDGKTVVPVGTPAFGVVMSATDSGGLGKSGRMSAKLLHIQLGNAEIPLEGEMSAKGTGAGSAGMAVLFTGVAGLFHRGNNAKIKAGELLSGFVAEDVWLDTVAAPIVRVSAPALAPSPQPVAAVPVSGSR
ncbi:hypothetical protein FHS96_002759 [Sphingomonas zeicaulis]|uniref:hypothetical protein n=1 Tax=Sphingomonas zeicaulis TaxID=1632740 RepID=UPI003D1B1BCD